MEYRRNDKKKKLEFSKFDPFPQSSVLNLYYLVKHGVGVSCLLPLTGILGEAVQADFIEF